MGHPRFAAVQVSGSPGSRGFILTMRGTPGHHPFRLDRTGVVRQNPMPAPGPSVASEGRAERKESRAVSRTSRYLDSALIVLAIAVRLAAVWVLRSHEMPRTTYEHGEIAA